MTRERVIERVRKLLALSNSCNEHEAALAAAHAQRLLSEHNLAMSELEVQQQGAGEVELQMARTITKWISSLFATVASALDCMPVVTTETSRSRLRFIGVGEDPEVAACTLEFLIRELRRLASAYLAGLDQAQGKLTTSQRQKVRNSYLLGGAFGVAEALRRQKASTPTTSTALVPVKDALIRQYCEQNFGQLKNRRSRSSTVISQAFQQGNQDGAALQLNSQRKVLAME